MSYSSGISGGSNLQDIFRYQQARASLQSNSSKGASSAWPDIAQGPATSTAASATTGSSQTQSATANAVTGSGSGATLSSELSNLLMEFQQVLSQFEQGAGTSSDAQTAGSSGATSSTGTASDASATSSATTTASATDPSQVAAAQPHHHHHHHHSESQSSTSSDQTSGSSDSATTDSDPLAQLLGTAAGSSSGSVSQADFEKALASGQSTDKADKLFAKLDSNGDGTIDQSEAQNALKHFTRPQNAAGMQSLFSGSQTGGQGNSSQGSWLSGSNLLLMAQQLGQAA